MQKIIAELRAKGVSELAIDEIERALIQVEKRRELERAASRRYRAKLRQPDVNLTQTVNLTEAQPVENVQHRQPDVNLTGALSFLSKGLLVLEEEKRVFPSESPLETSLVALAKIEKPKRKKPKTALPPDWRPKGPQRDPAEADEFRNHALAKDYRYADWDRAYLNFQNSPYNRRGALVTAATPAAALTTAAARRAHVEAERLRVLAEETGHGENREATGIRQGAELGPCGASDAPKLRLAGGISYGKRETPDYPVFAHARPNRG